MLVKLEVFLSPPVDIQGGAARQIACELQTWLKFIQVPKKLNLWFFSSSFFTIDFKLCLYARCFDTAHCPHGIFWLHLVNSPELWENNLIAENLNESHWRILFSQSFEELAKCSQNMSCGQCEVSKHLAYRHILKSIVKKLEEKNQKFSFSKLDLSLPVHMQSAVLFPLILYSDLRYRLGMVNSKSFVGKILLRIKWKFELTVHFKHEMLGKW